MTATAHRSETLDETTAVNLADEHAEEAVRLIAGMEDGPAPALVHALLALGARVDALRETLNRELPDIGGAIADAAENAARL